jgi:hypothetical protein
MVVRLDAAEGKVMVASGWRSAEGQTLQIHRMAPKVSRAMSRS